MGSIHFKSRFTYNVLLSFEYSHIKKVTSGFRYGTGVGYLLVHLLLNRLLHVVVL